MKKARFVGLFVLLPFVIGTSLYLFQVSGFVRNYVPDFLWAFAFTSSLLVVWGGVNKWWFSLLFISFVVFELLQYLDIIDGTFDYFDIICYFAGYCSAFINYKIHE